MGTREQLDLLQEGSDHFTLKLACGVFQHRPVVISLHPPASQLFWTPSETPPSRRLQDVLPQRCVLCICFHWICHVRNPPSMAYSRYFFYRITLCTFAHLGISLEHWHLSVHDMDGVRLS